MRLKNLLGRKGPPAAEPSRPSDEPALTPRAWLLDLFERHGLTSTVHGDWVLPSAELPAIRGTWHARETAGRLDVHVMVREGVVIEECFAGVGAGEAGLADGLRNFTINSFHTLLSALWRRHDPGQVVIETWTVAGRRFRAFIGNVGTRSSNGIAPPIPSDMLSRLEAAIRSESLEHELHWFRFYVGHVNAGFTIEALKDNETWPAGEDALKSCEWVRRDGFYSARLFMVLRETADEAQPSA